MLCSWCDEIATMRCATAHTPMQVDYACKPHANLYAGTYMIVRVLS